MEPPGAFGAPGGNPLGSDAVTSTDCADDPHNDGEQSKDDADPQQPVGRGEETAREKQHNRDDSDDDQQNVHAEMISG